MQRDTLNGRTDRRTYLKVLGAGALTTGMVGVAGCLGAEADTRRGSNDNGGTDTGGDDSDSGSINCEDLRAEFTAYNAAGTPLIFKFDYPQDWEVDGAGNALRIGKNINPEAPTLHTADFDIYQHSIGYDDPDGIVEAQREESGYKQVATLDFAGEKIRVVGGGTVGYQYFTALPYDTSSGKREYHLVDFRVIANGDTDAFKACEDVAVELSEQTLQSFRPNPDSTIEES